MSFICDPAVTSEKSFPSTTFMEVFGETPLTSLFRLLPKYRSISLARVVRVKDSRSTWTMKGLVGKPFLKSVATAKSSLSSDHSQ